MKKHKLLFLGAALAAIPFVASADVPFNPSNFGDSKNTARHLDTFTLNNTSNQLGSATFDVNQSATNKAVFQNLSDATPFVTTAGATVEFSKLVWEGEWMHGFLYIDCGKDGGFNSNLNTVNYPTPTPDGFNVTSDPQGDVMAFSAYEIGSKCFNSRGTVLTSNNHGKGGLNQDAMGQFKIPDLKSGYYQALLKIDWSSLDQHAVHAGGSNKIEDNGGCAALFTIKVVPIITKSREITILSNGKGTVKFLGEENGVAQETKEFESGEVAEVVAEANEDEGYFFLNWTKDGEVVSTDATYIVDITDDKFTLTANFVTIDEMPVDTFDWSRYDQEYRESAGSSGRALTSFTLANRADESSQKFEINQVYSKQGVSIRFDKTDVVFNTAPGSTVDFSEFTYNGAWRDACLFINYNGDEGFNSRLNNTGLNLSEEASSYLNVLNPSPRGELVAFSSHEFADGVFYNSQGSTTDKNGKALNTHFAVSPCLSTDNMPSFTIPDWVEPGDYMALLKIAWGDLDQHPVATKVDDLISQGGCAVLFTIHVENTKYRVEWQTEGPAFEIDKRYKDAAHVTLHYNTDKIDPEKHFIQVYAVPVPNDGAASAPAYRTMARAAAEETDRHDNCIYPDNFENVGEDSEDSEDSENRTLVFTIPLNNEKIDKNNPTLHFAPTTKGYKQGTYTYKVTVKTFDKENENGESLSESIPQTISFETDPGATSGVVDIEEAATAAPRYYNLQGIEVAQPTSAGIYIVRQGNAVSKVYVK